ncbi:MAG TPA: sterol-binding protein [Thiotrichales bacterium]|nr:sterol-binding protein [Thiotrichales bacterium]
MQTDKSSHSIQPVLPAPLAMPLKLLPPFVHNRVLLSTLNRLFKQEIADGELDFLLGKTVHIRVDDAAINYRFTLENNRFIAAADNRPADLVLGGTLYHYLLLASREEDSDTLFFNRKLHMEGDTELGLYVKNFLDGLDMESHRAPAYLEALLKKSLPVYARLFG